jgi:signal transduction histidine kinase
MLLFLLAAGSQSASAQQAALNDTQKHGQQLLADAGYPAEAAALDPAMVEAAVEAVQPAMDAREHTLRLDRSAVPLVMELDAIRLTQVISNLLNNAAKYTEPGGRIALELARSGAEAVFRVRDSGIGILPEKARELYRIPEGERLAWGRQGGNGYGWRRLSAPYRLQTSS